METPRTRYSDEELEEFRAVILRKLETACRLFDELRESLSNAYGNDTSDTSPTFKALEEGANTLEQEATARLCERQRQFIEHLHTDGRSGRRSRCRLKKHYCFL